MPSIGRPPFFPQDAGGGARDILEADCLDRVGEVFPSSHHRHHRRHRSDGFLLGMAKGLRAWAENKKIGSHQRQSIWLDHDQIHILPDLLLAPKPPQINEKLIEDLDLDGVGFLGAIAGPRWNCQSIDKLAEYNYEFDKTNVRYDEDPKDPNGSEASMEVFTRFQGCWGAKGKKKADIEIRIFGDLDDLRIQ